MVHALVTLVLIVIFRKMLRLTAGILHNSQKMHQTPPVPHEHKAENLLFFIIPEFVCYGYDIARCLPPGGVVKWSGTPSGALIAVARH